LHGDKRFVFAHVFLQEETEETEKFCWDYDYDYDAYGYGLSPGSPRLAYISKNLRALRASFFCVPKKAATTECTEIKYLCLLMFFYRRKQRKQRNFVGFLFFCSKIMFQTSPCTPWTPAKRVVFKFCRAFV
jgi:hypothetical protein